MVLRHKRLLSILLLSVILISSCQAGSSQLVEIPDKDQSPFSTLVPSPEPQKVLSICLGEEPRSLFLYGDQSSSARIIRQAIYNWTVDDNLNYISAILDGVPSQENGQVTVTEVEVFPGQSIVDRDGNLTILAGGTEYRPSGCHDSSCADTYNDQISVLMDQVQVEFNLLPGISWSDGTLISPADSIYSYQVASLVYGTGGPGKLRYSSSYQLGEDGEIYWTGLPGYLGIISYGELFFDPLPEHLWLNLGREELLTSSQSTMRPLAWGLYQVLEWVHGDHLTLVPNEHNDQAQEPAAFDAVVFRFVNSPVEAMAAFQAGECQVIANQSGLDEFRAELQSGAGEDDLRIYHSENKAWEQLSFGINSINGGFNLLDDPALRKLMAGCIDREGIIAARLDADQVVDDIYYPGQYGINDLDPAFPYQPVESGLLLKEMGWIDEDGDPETPRLASGVDGVPDGTKLEFTLLTAEAEDLPPAVREIQEGLGSCGIAVEVEMLPAAELLAPGPEGPIFGRNFDLAYFAWAAGNYQPCRLYLSDEIPGLYPSFPKGWGGVNAPGFVNQEYDSYCKDLLTSLPDSDSNPVSIDGVRKIFRSEIPALPILFRREIIITAPGLEGFENDHFPLLWNIEAIQ